MSSEDTYVLEERRRVEELTSAGDVEALSEIALRRTGSSGDWLVRGAAVRALGRLGGDVAERALVDLIERPDPDDQVRTGAVAALARSGSDAPIVVEALRNALGDDHRMIRTWAADGLGRLAPPDAMDRLLPLLDDPAWLVRKVALRALGALGDERAIGPIEEARRRAPFWRRGEYRRAVRSIRSAADAADAAAGEGSA